METTKKDEFISKLYYKLRKRITAEASSRVAIYNNLLDKVRAHDYTRREDEYIAKAASLSKSKLSIVFTSGAQYLLYNSRPSNPTLTTSYASKNPLNKFKILMLDSLKNLLPLTLDIKCELRANNKYFVCRKVSYRPLSKTYKGSKQTKFNALAIILVYSAILIPFNNIDNIYLGKDLINLKDY